MTLIADITGGHTLLGDWLFLIAAVLALIGAVAAAPITNLPKLATWAACLLALALCLIAVGFLVL